METKRVYEVRESILYTENQILFAMTFAVTIIREDKAFAYLAKIPACKLELVYCILNHSLMKLA